jgi:hypothetical protein
MGGFEVAAEADGLVGFDECAKKSFDGGNRAAGKDVGVVAIAVAVARFGAGGRIERTADVLAMADT